MTKTHRKIPEGYVIIEMYNTSRNERHQPARGGVLINDENYWPVKLKHHGSGHVKWVNLHSDEPTVQSIVKETIEKRNRAIYTAMSLPSNPLSKKRWKNATEPEINYCSN